MTMEKPSSLKKGDKVMIVATARKISEEELRPAIEVLNKWGLIVVLGDNIYQENDQFSGTSEQRVTDLQKALDDEMVKAIFCARGGYGTVKIIDELDFSRFLKYPKWVVGYSDVTVLHNHINIKLSIQTAHATMPINFPLNTSESLSSLKRGLFGEELNYDFDANSLNKNGKANGVLIGGNLSIIYSLMGTASQLNTDGKILFIEDLDEYLYHVDRMMMNLRRAGLLENLSGLIVGGMSDMNDNAIAYGKTAVEIISDTVKDFDYPVCFDFPAGHLADNRTLIFGENVQLEVQEKCSLSFSS